jgi:FKBP-type peptidyl-prolyl cis-trans isomerase FklB
MKKFSFLAVAMAAVAFTSCNNGVGNTEIKADADSLAYEFGVANSGSLKDIAAMQFGVDSAYLDAFIEGMKEGALQEKVDSAKDARNKGVEFGKQIRDTAKGLGDYAFEGDSTKSINPVIILKGILDGHEGKAPYDVATAQENFQKKMEEIQNAKLLEQYGDNKTEGEKFLAENAKKEGVTTTESGLQYKVLVEGKGAVPTDASLVKVKYEGRFINGEVFDSNMEKDGTLDVKMEQSPVIQGWMEVLKLMPEGSKWEVYLPYNLAYGEHGSYRIEPFSALIFTIEIIDVIG